MHQAIGANDLPAVDLTDTLVTQAYAENWYPRTEVRDNLATDACFIGCAWSRRNHNAFRIHLLDLPYPHLVVSIHQDLRPELAKVLHEIISEGVVVIDDQKHRFAYFRARSIARIAAIALLTLS